MAFRQSQGELEDESFIFKEITWKIPNILSLRGPVDFEIRSSKFSFANGTWVLCMYPNGQTKYNSRSFIDFTAYRLQSLQAEQCVYFKIFIKTRHGKEFEALGDSHKFTSVDASDDGVGFYEFMKFSRLVSMQKALAPGGTLTVVFQMRTKSTASVEMTSQKTVAEPVGREVLRNCKSGIETYTQTEGAFVGETLADASKDCHEKSIEVFTQTEEDFGTGSEQPTAATPDKKIVHDYKELLLNGDNCDVTLLVKGQKFEAHRAILGARSPVFASMLKHNMKEKNTGLIDIVDCEPETFPDFLCFIYCGSVKSITSQNVCSLFKAADKYYVQDLKSECLTFMRRHMDVDNFCDVIALALRHNEGGLIKQSTDFFVKNALKIITTVKWQIFLSENPIESNELTIKALSADKSS